jgi:hypothetical protein
MTRALEKGEKLALNTDATSPQKKLTTEKLPCYNRKGFQQEELDYQATLYQQFQVVPYICRHCGKYHILTVR